MRQPFLVGPRFEHATGKFFVYRLRVKVLRAPLGTKLENDVKLAMVLNSRVVKAFQLDAEREQTLADFQLARGMDENLRRFAFCGAFAEAQRLDGGAARQHSAAPVGDEGKLTQERFQRIHRR